MVLEAANPRAQAAAFLQVPEVDSPQGRAGGYRRLPAGKDSELGVAIFQFF